VTELPLILHIPITPKAMPRPRGKAGQAAYYPKPYQEWRDEIGWLLRKNIGEIGRKHIPKPPWSIHATFGADFITLHISGAASDRPANLRGDLDNYVKALLDVLQDAEIIDDDKHVTAIQAFFHRSHDE
jgi:Holliday junction resolvase RusA-like endonuclease